MRAGEEDQLATCVCLGRVVALAKASRDWHLSIVLVLLDEDELVLGRHDCPGGWAAVSGQSPFSSDNST